jgi:hypothetical protein
VWEKVEATLKEPRPEEVAGGPAPSGKPSQTARKLREEDNTLCFLSTHFAPHWSGGSEGPGWTPLDR